MPQSIYGYSDMFEADQLKIIHKALKQLKRDVKANKKDQYEKGMGICGNLKIYLLRNNPKHYYPSVCDFVEYFAENWKHHSGVEGYPVPSRHKKHKHPTTAYERCNNVWKGEYGAIRMKLLNHIIKHVKEARG